MPTRNRWHRRSCAASSATLRKTRRSPDPRWLPPGSWSELLNYPQRPGVRFSGLPETRPEHFECNRSDGSGNDRDNNDRQVLPHDGQVAEEEAAVDERADPEQPAADAEEQKSRVGHAADACDERGEGPDERNPARDHDGLASVALVELVGAIERAAIEKARLLPAKYPRTEVAADPEVGVVSEHRGADERRHQGVGIEARRRPQRSGG